MGFGARGVGAAGRGGGGVFLFTHQPTQCT